MRRSESHMHLRIKAAVLLFIALLMAGCTSARPTTPPPPRATAAASVASVALDRAAPCMNAFVPHLLDHTTTMGTDAAVKMFENNGAGVAVNDLDGDGKLDIVLANLAGQNSIFWNQGELSFQRELMVHGDSRAVNIVDVDGDGQQDIVFTRRLDRPTYWRNLGGTGQHDRFEITMLPGVYVPAYAMTWADLDRNGTLDLVTGSYDAALVQGQIANRNAIAGGSSGVYAYTHLGNRYIPKKLSDQAQALAIALPDLNLDGQPDIMIGNDFDLPDQTWVRTDTEWAPTQPFATTTRNTMSIALGDVNNDGLPDLFAADMKPYDQSTTTLAEWLPMMQIMPPHPTRNDPQVNENVLQIWGPDGKATNQAYERDVDATGWSWSAQFGDLNNDGLLDLYVVNGMIGDGLFDYLPNHELVEQNQALRNIGNGQFTRVPEWGLGWQGGGRGMTIADLNNDGKLDIVINNLQSPAVLFENRLCSGSALEVDLRMPQSHNPYAIGAQLALHTSAGIYYREVQASSGYLSGTPSRIHFGFPNGAALQYLEIKWPDGTIAQVDDLLPYQLMTITHAYMYPEQFLPIIGP